MERFLHDSNSATERKPSDDNPLYAVIGVAVIGIASFFALACCVTW